MLADNEISSLSSGDPTRRGQRRGNDSSELSGRGGEALAAPRPECVTHSGPSGPGARGPLIRVIATVVRHGHSVSIKRIRGCIWVTICGGIGHAVSIGRIRGCAYTTVGDGRGVSRFPRPRSALAFTQSGNSFMVPLAAPVGT